jgi:hypothetical protein
MLQTCSFGLAVMNIDNGIGAGAFAALICKRISLKHPRKDDSVSTTEEIASEGDLLKRL